MSLKIAFMGSPDFAVPALDALVASGHRVVAVYCQPPRPAGRGHGFRPTPVQRRAEDAGIPVATPGSLRGEAEQAAFAALGLDVAVVAAYGLILPPPILAAPRHGCVNIHASLLPRWRGAAPIQRAIEAGDTETGISIMLMDAGLDTGPVLAAERIPIGADATAGELHDALAALGARLLLPTIDAYVAGRLQPVAQPDEGATYARKVTPEEGRLDWSQPSEVLARRVRAFTPWPGAWFMLDGERIKVVKAASECSAPGAVPGIVIDAAFGIACGRGLLRPSLLQRPGRRPVDAAAFLRGRSVPRGTRLA